MSYLILDMRGEPMSEVIDLEEDAMEFGYESNANKFKIMDMNTKKVTIVDTDSRFD